MKKVSFDFETFSECDLKSCGSWIYSNHPSTEVICMAYAYDSSQVELWLPGDELPDFVKNPANYELHAWNASFEYQIWHNTLKWPTAPLHLWHDSMALAAAMALPMQLGMCGDAMGLHEDKKKMRRGKQLIQVLCKPDRHGNRRRDPDLLKEFYDYCKQDVEAERTIAGLLRPLSATERQVWLLDQAINLRGVHIDREAATAIVKAIKTRSDDQEALFRAVTGGAVSGPRSYVALKDWVNRETGLDLTSVDKTAAAELLEQADLPPQVRQALEIKAELSKASVAKFKAMLCRTTASDHRVRGMFQYHGASTGRAAGRGVQLQNLTRDSYAEEIYEIAKRCFKEGDLDFLSVVMDDPYFAASRMVRGTICAPPGYELLCADFASIESRALAHLAGEQWVIDAYREGKDMYKVTAGKILGKSYEDVTKDERNRLGKPSLLGAGYGGGPNAIRNVGGGAGMTDEEIYAQIVTPWRESNPKIVAYWYDIERAAMHAIRNPGEDVRCRTIRFKFAGSFLLCRLPSGRVLSYYRPKIEPVETPWGEMKPAITYMGMRVLAGKTTTQWGRVVTRGSKIVENVTQAFCRDLLVEAMLRLDQAGFNLVAHIHDEILAEERIGKRDIHQFCQIMEEVPAWATGMPIAAEGWTGKRFRK